jgi:hypothetical protein
MNIRNDVRATGDRRRHDSLHSSETPNGRRWFERRDSYELEPGMSVYYPKSLKGYLKSIFLASRKPR